MRGRKRTSEEAVPTKKRSRRKAEEKNKAEEKEGENPSLPVLEETYFHNEHMKTRPANKVYKRPPLPPKVRITCVPLQIDKVIDLKNDNVAVNETRKENTEPPNKQRKTVQRRRRNPESTAQQINPDSKEKFPSIVSSKGLKLKCKIIKNCKATTDEESELKKENKALTVPKFKIRVPKNAVDFSENQDLGFSKMDSNAQTAKRKCQGSETKAQKGNKKGLNGNLDDEILNGKELSDYLPNCERNLTELSGTDLRELTPVFENPINETIKLTLDKTLNKSTTNPGLIDPRTLSSTRTTLLRCRDSPKQEKQKNKLPNPISLQAAVDSFLKIPTAQNLKEVTALKTGLCITWLSNNYVCFNDQCLYSHHAQKLFTKKLKNYPSKFVLSIVTAMRDDILFVDVIMAAFKVFSARNVPVVWVTILTYFVFYVIEPSDSRFLKFWANAARFYCQLNKQYTAANGFSSLLAIFSMGEKTEEWKIIEFIKLIKEPPFQVKTNYDLLQPVLKLDLPIHFLTEAIEFCIATQKDVLKVYESIIPKISFMTSPIQVIELLFKFCGTLEAVDLKSQFADLKWRLREKVKSFKMKITDYDYPLTSVFQKDMSNENSSLESLQSIPRCKEIWGKVNPNHGDDRSNYFRPEDEFNLLLAQTIDLDNMASRAAGSAQSIENDQNNELQEDDISERQLARIRQFFRERQFDLLGKYLNDIKTNVVEEAANEFLKLLLKMKISLQQGVDIIRIILSSCKSSSAADIIASVCITLILNFVKINDWEKAYKIVSLCKGRQINLVKGKVLLFSQQNILTQCRIALLLIEINAYNEDYSSAMTLLKNHRLSSSDSSLWKVTCKAHDETVRVMILEYLLKNVVSKEFIETAYDLFMSIWGEQKRLNGPVDLRKFVNEILILLLNEGNEEAITLYDKIKNEVQLNDITIRAIIVTLARRNLLPAAKSVLISAAKSVYCMPDVIVSGSCTFVISRSWLEEEIFVIFDKFLEEVVAKKSSVMLTPFEILEINIKISSPKEVPSSRITPLCLGIINPSFEDACSRITRVLTQFNPPLKLIIEPFSIKVDEYSLEVYVHNKILQHLRQVQ